MKQRKVRDLMTSLEDYATIHENRSIREALEVLSSSQKELDRQKHYHRSVLVLDDEGMVVGKLSHWAILRSLDPRFLKYKDEEALFRAGLTDDFIQSMQETLSLFTADLEQMCRATGKIKARDAMVPVNESIDEDMPLTDAIHQMVLSHALSILVTRENRVVGILRQSDVFQEINNIIRSIEA